MNRYSDILAEYSRIGRLRRMPDGDILAGMIDLSGNDYLGIGAKGRIAELFLKELFGTNSTFTTVFLPEHLVYCYRHRNHMRLWKIRCLFCTVKRH